jgi:copper chaperone CopZ
MKDRVFIGASLLAAVAASLCCILPIVFALGGFAIVGASAFFESLRPYFLVATFALLGAGFYLAYRNPKRVCEPGSVCARPQVNRFGRIGLWIATVIVLAFAAFPYYSGTIANLVLSDGSVKAPPAQRANGLQHVSLAVRGMYCQACAQAVESRLMSLSGVRKATVSYEASKAEVVYDAGTVTLEQLEKAIQDAGYQAQKM